MKEIIITLFYFMGANSIPFDANGVNLLQPCQIYEEAQRVTGVKIKIDRFIIRRNWGAELWGLENWTQRHSHRIKAYMYRRKVKGIRLAQTPPINTSDNRYIAGLASVCNPISGWGVAHTQHKRTNGMDGIEPSTKVMRHELMHVLGANHDNDSANVMHEWITGIQPYGATPVTLKSTNEMKSCLKRNGFYKRKAK
jgi:hypothetical protein